MSVPRPTKSFLLTITLSALNRSTLVPLEGPQLPQPGGAGTC